MVIVYIIVIDIKFFNCSRIKILTNHQNVKVGHNSILGKIFMDSLGIRTDGSGRKNYTILSKSVRITPKIRTLECK